MLLSEGQMSDYKGAALMLPVLPNTKALLGDRGYDADWLRQALADQGITACIPSKTNRKVQITHNKVLYRQRHRIKNMFSRLKPVLSLSKGTGAASTPAMIDAPTPSCPPSQSPPPSSSGSDQRVLRLAIGMSRKGSLSQHEVWRLSPPCGCSILYTIERKVVILPQWLVRLEKAALRNWARSFGRS